MSRPIPPRDPGLLGDVLRTCHERYLQGAALGDVFETLLTSLQASTGSAVAAVGRLHHDEQGAYVDFRGVTAPAAGAVASSSSRPADATACQGAQRLVPGSPAEQVLCGGQPVVLHGPLPPGALEGLAPADAPAMTTFLGLSLTQGGAQVGMLALAGRPGGYAPEAIQLVEPALHLLGSVVVAMDLEGSQREALLTQGSAPGSLARNEASYRQMFQAAGVGIARLSPGGRLLDVNQRLADICQRSQAELLRLSLQDIIDPEDLAVNQALVEAALAGRQESFSVEQRLLGHDGQVLWVQINSVLVRDDAGEPMHFVAVIEDISERRRYQEAILSAKAAERASQAKTEFLSRMSHELRTPLNAMLGFAQLLRVDPRHPLNDSQRQKVRHIEQAGAHLLAMLTDVLDLSRIEAGSLPLSLEVLRVADVVNEAITMVSTHAQQEGLGLTSTDVAERLYVRADRLRLRQILVNLLSNAIKYNRPGGQVRLEVQGVRPDVVIAVHDTGKGLTAEQQAHLFEPFNRLGAERSGVEGTGIGLVIVQRLARLMQGRIEVSSVAGHGSVFRVHLPWATPPHDEHDDAPVRSGFGELASLGGDPQGLSLLYAEDNMVNVELVRQVMRMRPQWTVEVALCGAEAIEMAMASPPDLLLLDMHLGDMSGLDVADALSRHAHTMGIPKVALSADVMPDQLRAARERGFLDYLTKPLDVSRLLRLLDSFKAADQAGA